MNLTALMDYAAGIASRAEEFPLRVAEHLALVFGSTLLATFLGISIGLLIHGRPRLQSFTMLLVSLLQVVPGMALLVLALAIFGKIGVIPALFSLTLYALLPVARATQVGLASMPPNLVETARGIGLSRSQRLLWLQLPMALPHLVAGVRIAAVQAVGMATLAAFIGAGGLGQYINRGLFISSTELILLGAIPAALLAWLTDALLAMLGMALDTPHVPPAARRFYRWASLAILLALLGFTASQKPYAPHEAQRVVPVVVGSKSFTESLILGEIVAQYIEKFGTIPVERRLGLGGTTVLHDSLRQGEIDIAPEYTGTALSAIMNRSTNLPAAEVFPAVKEYYRRQFGILWLKPLGFNNTYVLTMRSEQAKRLGITNLSELRQHAGELTAGFDFEFAEREDGYRGLRQREHVVFAGVRDMHPDMMQNVLRLKEVDVISGYRTDGRLADPFFTLLDDDLNFFPPYEACLLVGKSAQKRYPQLKGLLATLSGSLNDETMQQLNAEVDQKGKSVKQAAAMFVNELPKPSY